MSSAYFTITIVTAAANSYAATPDFARAGWIPINMKKLGVDQRWLTPLGMLKVLGAAGLLVGIWIPPIGVAAAAGLVAFFVGAIVTAMHARWYGHIPFPTVWLLLAVASLVFRLRTA